MKTFKTILFGLFSVALIILAAQTHRAFAVVGEHVDTGSGSGSTWDFNCNYFNTCPRWIKVSISQFKDIWENNKMYPDVSSIKADLQDAYDICTNNTKNKSGFIIMAGEVNSNNPGGMIFINLDEWSYGGTILDIGKYKINNQENTTGVYGTYDATTGSRRYVLDDTISDGITTIRSLMSEASSERKLAITCEGLNSPTITEDTDTYNVTETAKINGLYYSDGSKYTVSSGVNTVTVSFNSSVSKTNNKGISHPLNYSYSADGNSITVDGLTKIASSNGTITVDIPEADESTHRVCGNAKINPRTRNFIYSDGALTSETTSGSDTDSTCVLIKRNYVPAEPSYSYPTATATFYSTKPDVNPNGNPYTVAKNIESITVNFSNARNITGPTKNDPNNYFIKASVTPNYDSDDFIVIGDDSQTVHTPDNGEVIYRAACQSITDSVTYTYTFRETQQRVKNVDTGLYENVGSPTYEFYSKSSGTKNGTKETCLDIYREAESLIETRTDISLSGNYTSDGINYLTTKRASSDGEYTPNPAQISYDPTKNTGDPKVFIGSDNSDKININYTYFLKRKAHPNNWDAKYALNFSWNTYSILTDNGITNLNPANDWRNVYSSNSTKEVKNDSGELELGTYNKEFCNSITSNNRAYKIQHGKITVSDSSSEYSGNPESTACAHLYRPWNYNLEFTEVSTGIASGMLIDEGSATISVTLKNNANNSTEAIAAGQEGNPSYSPENTTIELYRIKVSDRADLDNKNNQLAPGGDGGKGTDLSGSKKITTIKSGETTKSLNYDGGTNSVEFADNYNEDGDSLSVGEHICYYAKTNYSNSVQDTNGSAYGNKHGYGNLTPHPTYSRLTCFTVVGYPHMEVWGGSVFSEGEINTKIHENSGTILNLDNTPKNSGTYIIGSWSDFAIIGKNNIKGLISGKSISFRYKNDTYDCDNHPLTINNNSCTSISTRPAEKRLIDYSDKTTIGHNTSIVASKTKNKLLTRYGTITPNTSYTTSTTIRDKEYYCYSNGDYTTQTDCDPSDPNKNKYRYSYSDGNLSIGNITLDIGATHIIHTTGDITINGNIGYQKIVDGYKDINQIPQYIIIADGNIKIDQNVTVINAWLITEGTIDTCNDHVVLPDGSYDKQYCSNSLDINGPVFANRIEFSRTGYIPKMNSYSEKLDINALSIYWAYFQAKQAGRMTTVYLHSLPPRL